MCKTYAIDSCALIGAAVNYPFTKRMFAPFWETIDKLVKDGQLVSSVIIKKELKDEDVKEWARLHSTCFLPLTREIQAAATEILKKFPKLIRIRSVKNSNADPFLIATAQLQHATVVTQEKRLESNSERVTIPNVCDHLGIECLSLANFVDEITV